MTMMINILKVFVLKKLLLGTTQWNLGELFLC